MKKLLGTAAAVAGVVGALALSMAVPTVAQASTFLGGCSTTDLNPAAAACNGYYEGNQLGGNADDLADQLTALNALGAGLASVDDIVQLEHIELGGLSNVDFNTLLNGDTYIGIHWGAGLGPGSGDGGETGFYRLDLASDAELDSFLANFGSQSGAVLFITGECEGRGCGETPGGVVPEPATWAMMIMGFGGVGALMRRRRDLLTTA